MPDHQAAHHRGEQVRGEDLARATIGGSRMKTMLPVIFDWISDEELLANAFCSIAIIARPGHQELHVGHAREGLHVAGERVREHER